MHREDRARCIEIHAEPLYRLVLFFVRPKRGLRSRKVSSRVNAGCSRRDYYCWVGRRKQPLRSKNARKRAAGERLASVTAKRSCYPTDGLYS